MLPTPADITRHHDSPPEADAAAWVEGHRQEVVTIRVVEYDATWPSRFDQVAELVRSALGDGALEVNHVGSTSVPGLPAKPIIDADLVVADPADEASYVPALTAAGFVHVIREPWWHEHRLLRFSDPQTNLHVFGPDCPEVIRHQMFRQWLLDNPDELTTYADAKRAAAQEINGREGGGTGMDYNRAKESVVRAIYDRMFRAHGLLP